jgi:fatty acid desaturase
VARVRDDPRLKAVEWRDLTQLTGWQLARTQRSIWKNLMSYEMFYQVEHHLFPAAPTPRLPELAARLDRAMPHLSREQVF